jgi:TRAP transporter TAXI family solute receptor
MAYQVREKKRRALLWIVVIVLTVAMIGVGMLFMTSPPPKKIRMATGQKGGGYDTYGKKYQERLNPLGLQVELVNTAGSIENIQQLAQKKVDIAFVQGGTYGPVQERDDPEHTLRALAAVYLEPLWVFYRDTKPAESGADKNHGPTLSDFKGKSISIGPPGSGTEAVSRDLLKAHDIDPDDPAHIKQYPSADAREHIEKGDLDVAILVSSYMDKGIQELLQRDDVQLLNFRRDTAYAKKFTYLTPVKLAEGMVDLQHDYPREDKILLAPSALLVAREDLHPDVVAEVLKVARSVHEKGTDLDPPHKYPTLDGIEEDLPVHESAVTFMKSGESFLSKLLPYWALRWVLRLQLLLLPLVAVWVPLLKILPMVYNWRVNRLLHQHYAALREVESDIAQTNDPVRLRERLKVLENLRSEMEALSRKVPARLQRDVYHWRLHVSLVHSEAMDRLQRMEGAQASAAPAQPLETSIRR